MLFITLTTICILVAGVSAEQSSDFERGSVCFGEHGCFSNSYPFSGVLARPIALLPESPAKVGVLMSMYNRKTPSGASITTNNIPASFQSNLNTKFIVHGFLHNGNKKWVLEMKDAILRVDDVNVIAVDWGKGNGFPYTQATANTQIVAAEISLLIEKMIATKGCKAASFHVIGHSLGSHIGGYVGKRVAGLGRITALDPAGPYFENTDPAVRLSPKDAVFVDAIHTDGTGTLKLGLGLMQQVGHVDFYPNGGINQPECPQTSDKLLSGVFNIATMNVVGLEDGLVCSHSAAIYYFTTSIEDKSSFTSYPCASLTNFDNGLCIICSKGCNKMGYWVTPTADLGSLYLNTLPPLSIKPTSLQNLRVKLVSDKNSGTLSSAKGTFKIYFRTAASVSSEELLDKATTVFAKNTVETRLVSLSKPMRDGPITSAYVSYARVFAGVLFSNEWNFWYIEVFDGETQKTITLCPYGKLLNTSIMEYRTCTV